MNKLLKILRIVTKNSVLKAKLSNCKNFEHFYVLCKEIYPDLKKEELAIEILNLIETKLKGVEEKMLKKVSGGKIANRFLSSAVGALMITLTVAPNARVLATGNTLSPNVVSVTEKMLNDEDLELASLNSAKDFYEYLKNLQSNFTESDFVEFINNLFYSIDSGNENPISIFKGAVKKLVSEGKTEFEAISQACDFFIEQYKGNALKILQQLFYNFISKNFMEVTDHLTQNGEGIAIIRKAWDWPMRTISGLPKYNGNTFSVDFRHTDLSGFDLREYADLKFAMFDSRTIWPPKDKLPNNFNPQIILEEGKNPGLKIKTLHEKGVNGNGVGIAIIDQTLLSTHEEYKDNLKLYEEIAINKIKGADDSGREAAMHASAVASLAVGKTCGVAPKADLYQIGTDCHGTENMCKDTVRQIDRILEINKKLPQDKKIRVISISRGYDSRYDKDYTEFKTKVEEAKKQGVFVITTSVNSEHNFGINVRGLSRFGNVDQSSSYKFGDNWLADQYYSNDNYLDTPSLFIPMGNRTTAGFTGNIEYQYDVEGGYSWIIPWLSGCYALCCQIKPDISPEIFMKVAFETGDILNNTSENTRKDKNNARIINPQKLIEKLKA